MTTEPQRQSEEQSTDEQNQAIQNPEVATPAETPPAADDSAQQPAPQPTVVPELNAAMEDSPTAGVPADEPPPAPSPAPSPPAPPLPPEPLPVSASDVAESVVGVPAEAMPQADVPSGGVATPAPPSVATVEETPVVGEVSAEIPTDDSPAAAARPGDPAAAARIRQKLSEHRSDNAGSGAGQTFQKREVPPSDKAVEIPGADDLDVNLEAEINSALSGETGAVASGTSAPPEAVNAGAVMARAAEHEVGPGSRVKGTVQHIHGDDVFLNAGLRSDVVVALRQFPADKQPEIGSELEVVIDTIDEDGVFRARLPQARTRAGGNWDGLAVGQVVDCQVTGTNKGGLEVLVSNLKAFLPASQVEMGFTSDLE
ncbi:MAG: hypothetical protein KDA89_25035, partial [Planctomycetaceae bacterium]|nr:hypothetical protein [Planctomycetaceae bacterium]